MTILGFLSNCAAQIPSERAARTTSLKCSRSPLLAARFFVGALAFVTPFTGVRGECSTGDADGSAAGVCAAPTMAAATGLSQLSGLRMIDGAPLPAETFDGKIALAVNVASACGYTNSGYRMMREVQERYPDDVVVVAVPCNAFGRQESGTPEEIRDFASGRVKGVVVTERSEVNGPNAHPIMALGKAAFPGEIRWNFAGVFLFDRTGKPVQRFDNSASSADVLKEVEKIL